MFGFCKHKWNIISTCIGQVIYEGGRTRDITSIMLQCQNCGNVKEKTITGQFWLGNEKAQTQA